MLSKLVLVGLIAATGERMQVGLAPLMAEVPPPASPSEHARRLVVLLLLAFAACSTPARRVRPESKATKANIGLPGPNAPPPARLRRSGARSSGPSPPCGRKPLSMR